MDCRCREKDHKATIGGDKDDDDFDEDKASTQFDFGDLPGPDKRSKSVIPHRFYENGMKTYFDQFDCNKTKEQLIEAKQLRGDTNKKTREMRQPARVVVGVFWRRLELSWAIDKAGDAKVYPWRAGEFDPLASAMVGVVEWRILEVVGAIKGYQRPDQSLGIPTKGMDMADGG
ncbi:hypothetical protein PPACK8108_LOCUS12281 [Phakopsora pachyrhizi]|uniref:Uncharacterized protein n=1 Tax=Phakopsora pachyrhizi TaxID=170000 RepID=A0AAV0B2N9_PHAPC|nr:hypothetical protein PPACK8108_LOCUS12281 [Phakopsora pachyrhizi]